MKTVGRILPLFVLLASMTSCFNKIVKTVMESTNLEYVTPAAAMYADHDFGGLNRFIESSTGQANILLVHGLSGKKPDNFDFMVERMAYVLDLKLTSPKRPVPLGQKSTNDSLNRVLGFGKWESYNWTFEQIKSPGKKVSFNFIYWAPITAPAKQFLADYNKTEHRTTLSSFAKESFLIDVFGDLALFINEDYKKALHKAFLTAIEPIDGDIAVVGGGFGVQILFETLQFELDRRAVTASGASDSLKEKVLQSMEKKNRSINVRDLATDESNVDYKNPYKISKVFLISNQMPFVSLLSLKPDDAAVTAVLNEQVYWTIKNFVDHKRKNDANYALDLVSFYDPNDPFGYKLPPCVCPGLHINNVAVNVAEYWNIDPKTTTDFVLPKLKGQRATDLFLSVIDQRREKQSLMLNIKGPADQSRNDLRVISAIALGSDYKSICLVHPVDIHRARNLEVESKQKLDGLKRHFAEALIEKVKFNLDVQSSVLPFSIPSEFRDTSPDTLMSRSFGGMDVSIAGDTLTQLLTVHGMRNQEPDHFDELTAAIAKSLGFYGRPVRMAVKCDPAENCKDVGPLEASYRPGTVKITEFKGVYGKRLVIYSVYWSSISRPPKQWLDSTSIYQESSVVPKTIKQALITDGFADITLTFGNFDVKVDGTLTAAFEEMQNDFTNANLKGTPMNTYFITGSLGSRLLLDYLDVHKATQSVHKVMGRTQNWFMLTNQLIMTAMKDVRMPGGSIPYDEFYQETFRSIATDLEDKNSRFKIVAFNDPNDLLSFVVPDSVMGVSKGKGKIYNNYVNLAQGRRVNMNAFIRYAYKTDKFLQKKHYSKYDDLIISFEKSKSFPCSAQKNTVTVNDNPYRDFIEMLKIGRDRFDPNRPQYHAALYDDVKTKLDDLLRESDVKKREELGDLLMMKKKWATSDLYVTTQQFAALLKEYKVIKKNSPARSMISRANFRRLYEPGLIMPFLRSVSDKHLYQNFVVDFGTAHTGAKNSARIVEMIAHGFKDVRKTNVDQKLYSRIHNKDQN